LQPCVGVLKTVFVDKIWCIFRILQQQYLQPVIVYILQPLKNKYVYFGAKTKKLA